MQTNNICLLNTINDAKHFLSSQEHSKEWLLVTTHYSVNEYLNTNGIDCKNLSEFIDQGRAARRFKATLPDGELYRKRIELTEHLDHATKGIAHQTLKTSHSLDIFAASFGYFIHLCLSSHYYIENAVKNIFLSTTPDSIIAYKHPSPPFFEVQEYTVLQKYIHQNNIDVRLETRETNAEPAVTFDLPLYEKSFLERQELRLKNLARISRNVFSRREKKPKITPEVVLLGSHYAFSSLLSSDSPLRPRTWAALLEEHASTTESLLAQAQLAHRELLDILAEAEFTDSAQQTTLEAIRRHVKTVGPEGFCQLALLDTLLREKKITALLWGNGPGTQPFKSLLCALAMKSGIPVIGYQHGGNYGVQDAGLIHILGDFDHCTHFLSWGFTKDDLAPMTQPLVACDIIPLGNPKQYRLQRHTVPKRVIHPPNVSFPLRGVVHTIPLHQLAANQRHVIEQLGSCQDLDVWIKPYPLCNDTTFALFDLLGNTRNFNVCGDPLSDFLYYLKPSLIVLDYLSSPLFDALEIVPNADIFWTKTDIYQIQDKPLDLLKRRVHVFDSAQDMMNAVRNYPASVETPRRDQAFKKTYLRKSQSHDVASTLQRIIDQYPNSPVLTTQ